MQERGSKATRQEFETLRRKQLETQIPRSPCCGDADDRSLVGVDESGRFEFRGLAAGTYFLRALDALQRAQPTLCVEIGRGENRVVDLSLAPDVSLQVDLRDEAGEPFVGRWKNDGSEGTAPIGTTKPFVPVAVDAFPIRDFVGRVVGARRMDRARLPSDSLAPAAPIPAFAGVEDRPIRARAGSYVVTHMPAIRIRISATCCGATTPEVELDLADPAARVATLVLASQ